MDTPHGIRRAALAVIPLALLLTTVGIQQARAGIIQDTTFTFTGCEDDTCIGLVCYELREHVVVRSEGRDKCGIHVDIHGTGTGPNGEHYVISATQNAQLDNCGASGCTDVVSNLHFIGQGSAPNLIFHVTETFCCCPFTLTIKSFHIKCN